MASTGDKKEELSGSEPELDSEGEESDSPGTGNNDVYTGNEKIQVDFEGRNPVDCDYHGIKQLLGQLFLNAKVNTNELAELIIGQNYVGSVLTQCLDTVDPKTGKTEEEGGEEEDEDDDSDDDDENMIFGLTTVLNITHHQAVNCVKQLRTYLIEKCEKSAEDEVAAKLRDILGNDSKPTGFIVNERFINIPPQISIPMLESLAKEMRRADEKKMPFKFSQFLMVLKYYKPDEGKAKSKKAKGKKPQAPMIHYSNPEEEVFDKSVILSYEFSVAEDADSGLTGNWLEDDEALTPYRKVIVFEAKQLSEIISNIKDFVE